MADWEAGRLPDRQTGLPTSYITKRNFIPLPVLVCFCDVGNYQKKRTFYDPTIYDRTAERFTRHDCWSTSVHTMMYLIYANVQICRYADILYIYVQICTYLINIYRYAQIYRYGPGPAQAWGGGAPGWVPGCLGLGLGGPFCRHHFTRKNTIPGPGRPPGDSSFKVANYYHNILKKYYEKSDSDQVWFIKCPFGFDRMGT